MKSKFVKENLNEGFDTEAGRQIESIFSLLGYDGFHEFVGDNPGCIEVMIEWIEDHFSDRLMEEGLSPEELEDVGLYTTAEKVREEREPGNE